MSFVSYFSSLAKIFWIFLSNLNFLSCLIKKDFLPFLKDIFHILKRRALNKRVVLRRFRPYIFLPVRAKKIRSETVKSFNSDKSAKKIFSLGGSFWIFLGPIKTFLNKKTSSFEIKIQIEISRSYSEKKSPR